MSCHICTDEHIASIAVYYAKNIMKSTDDDISSNAINSAHFITLANYESVNERYGENNDPDFIPVFDAVNSILENIGTDKEHPILSDSVDINGVISSANCLAYQLCDSSAYNDSPASKILKSIEKDCIDKGSSLDPAGAWGEYEVSLERDLGMSA